MARLEKPREHHPCIANLMRYLVNPPTVDARVSDPGILVAAAQR